MKKDLRKVFGEVLRSLREDRELSQQELADYSEIDRTYLSDLERGLNFPTLNVVFKLAEVLKISASELVSRVERSLK